MDRLCTRKTHTDWSSGRPGTARQMLSCRQTCTSSCVSAAAKVSNMMQHTIFSFSPLQLCDQSRNFMIDIHRG